MSKYFTPDEANRILPRVRTLIQQVMHAREIIVAARPELWPVLEKGLGNGGSKKAGEMIHEFRRIEQGLHELTELGVTVKDISIGLVDFPALRAGREILLCWKYDEPEVAYWHELQSGYAGRQKI